MDSSAIFRLNSPHVVQEIFDGEVVVVNLNSGRYYCLQGSGIDVWKLLTKGHAIGSLSRILTGTYDASYAEIESAAISLVGELEKQELIVPASGQTEPDGAALQPKGPEILLKPFEMPKLQVYTDMQELLLLDPIHEVDDHGWPVAKKPVAEKEG